MHPVIFETFEKMCAPLAIRGRVLEMGASRHHQSLLTMLALKQAVERIGIGLDGAMEGEGHSIRHGNANDLSAFADGSFELVLSNSMLEHDPKFWLSIAEARRVTTPGGYLAVGVPAYGAMGAVPARRLYRRLSRLPLIGARRRQEFAASAASSLTLGIHNFPGDYYRFSEQAMRDVIFEGMEVISTDMLFQPPRVFGLARKPLGTLK
jgi:ubiquinone/menaquinone biosynthesis C-methylase UbiE